MAIVTITTDFGTADGYVGAMKGVLARLAPGVQLVDLTHDIPRHDIAAGAFAVAQAARHFPPATVHLVVVDPGVGGARLPVVVDDGLHRFVAPDNGVLELAVSRPVAVHAIESEEFRAPAPCATFHGRDIFAVAAARLATGAAVAEAGPAAELCGRLVSARSEDGVGSARATVVHVDAFGNLITNCPAERLSPAVQVRVGGRLIGPLRTSYEQVNRGALVAYVGSGGTLEVAVREGSAAELLGVRRGDAMVLVAPESADV